MSTPNSKLKLKTNFLKWCGRNFIVIAWSRQRTTFTWCPTETFNVHHGRPNAASSIPWSRNPSRHKRISIWWTFADVQHFLFAFIWSSSPTGRTWRFLCRTIWCLHQVWTGALEQSTLQSLQLPSFGGRQRPFRRSPPLLRWVGTCLGTFPGYSALSNLAITISLCACNSPFLSLSRPLRAPTRK